MKDKSNQFSQNLSVFRGRRLPPDAKSLAGYGALIKVYELKVPLPSRLSVISKHHRRHDDQQWHIYTPRYQPELNFKSHLIFALRHEGLDLLVLKALFQALSREEVEELVRLEPTSRHGRRIWFLYEWLLEQRLELPDCHRGNYVDLLDPRQQIAGPSEKSPRHRVNNNLPGTRAFCPLIRRTQKLEDYKAADLGRAAREVFGEVPSDVVARASAFLLLEDSKASFAIEGERLSSSRAQRWGQVLGQAGRSSLDGEELLRLQQLVIGDNRFTRMGWRREGGFVGHHDRDSGAPLPEHISARPQDIKSLIGGLLDTEKKLEADSFDPVLCAALIAFGFVFIHPFADGNGRIHRYLIHHVLSSRGIGKPGVIFPVSSVILEEIDAYRRTLEAFSKPLLEFIEWRATRGGNVEVLNDTSDLYRYFDATELAEYLYACVERTVRDIMPKEVDYLARYDRMRLALNQCVEMPDRSADMLIRFLRQNKGRFSKRARAGEFKALTEVECRDIEAAYAEIFEV